MTTPLEELFKHNLWANLAILSICSDLSDEQLDATFPGTYGSIRDTLVHLAGAEELYTHMMQGKPRPPRREGQAFPGFDTLREMLGQTGQQLIDIVQNNAIPANYLDIENNEKLTGGMIVILVINHATEHRAHIGTILAQLGVEFPELDGWSYGFTHDLLTSITEPKEIAS